MCGNVENELSTYSLERCHVENFDYIRDSTQDNFSKANLYI